MFIDKIGIDGKIIEALASGTRRVIIKKLYYKPRTVSEISREMDINKSAICKHLNILIQTGLIIRKENGNEFVYYELSTKGKNIIEINNNVKITILLSSSVFAFIFGFLEIYLYQKEINKTIYWGESTVNVIQLIIGITLVLISIFIFVYILRIWNRIYLKK
jgi:predicted transcriptional regulator